MLAAAPLRDADQGITDQAITDQAITDQAITEQRRPPSGATLAS
ncbi:hypothetical protein ACWDRR_23460 [Kitasatospora sp. NPDC003701]